jgi:hypothetical protein
MKAGSYLFCSGICHDNGRVLEVLDNVPPSDVMEYVANARRAPCATCGNAGPIDVWSSFRARSVVFYTSWSTVKKLECRSCARKRQWGDLSYSLVAGWWGVPWGIFVTPVQVIRNIIALLQGNRTEPSRRFQQVIKIDLARKLSARTSTQ